MIRITITWLVLVFACLAVASASSHVESSSIDCQFDETLCTWMPDPRDTAIKWQIENATACVRPRPQLSSFYFDGDAGLNVPRARLWSASVVVGADDVRCLSLVYTLSGFSGDEVALSLLRHSSGVCEDLIDSKTGRHFRVCDPQSLWNSSIPSANRSWQKVSVDLLNTTAKDFKLILEGVIPAGYPDAKICVDNITSYTEPCSALEPKPAMSTASTYTWAHYFGITFIVALAFGLLIPILFLVGIIVVCRRRHACRHHHSLVCGSGGGSYGNSKLFTANLWHYIGGKEAADDPFAEHSASIHRPPFSNHKFSEGTLGMRGDGTLDLPDVVIPSGRVVGGTLMRQSSHPVYTGVPYGYQTMMTGKQMMAAGYNGVTMTPQPNMVASQTAFPVDMGGQSMMPNMTSGSQPITMSMSSTPPTQLDGAMQPMTVQPANYFHSLVQPAATATTTAVVVAPTQSSTVHNVPPPHPSASTVAAVAATVAATPVVGCTSLSTPTTAGALVDNNGPFVLPDPPSDHQQERDQVAAALDALNAATETPQPRQSSSASARLLNTNGEHPPPGYDEAVGLVSRPAKINTSTGYSNVTPILPPRRTTVAATGTAVNGGGGNGVTAEHISIAERYGLPVAEI